MARFPAPSRAALSLLSVWYCSSLVAPAVAADLRLPAGRVHRRPRGPVKLIDQASDHPGSSSRIRSPIRASHAPRGLARVCHPTATVSRSPDPALAASWPEVDVPVVTPPGTTRLGPGVVSLDGWTEGLLPFEPGNEVVGGHRPADVVPLDGVAAKDVQLLQGERVLDAFGDDPQAKVAAEVDGGTHDHRAAGVADHLRHE